MEDKSVTFREAYDNHSTKTVATKMIIAFFSLILTLNKFDFSYINYLQIMGCAMGVNCALAYANIFMTQFEKQHISLYQKQINTVLTIY